MATKAIIRCKTCKEKFTLYWSDMKHDAIQCPNCNAKMTEYLSEKVLNAFAAVVDANTELYKAYLQEESPLFEIDFTHKNDPK